MKNAFYFFRWTGYTHPDPTNQQFKTLQDAFEKNKSNENKEWIINNVSKKLQLETSYKEKKEIEINNYDET